MLTPLCIKLAGHPYRSGLLQMGVEDKELQALAAGVREHLETPEAKEAAQNSASRE